eukprot:15064331-Ditylum_brightwellii.AAC.1
MLEHMVVFVILWLNAFMPKTGIAKTLSSRVIVTGTTLSLSKHCRIPFGAYAQTHEEGSTNMNDQTLGAIVLGLIGNIQGSYELLNLKMGKLIVRRDFDEIPMTDEVKRQVEELGKAEKQAEKLEFLDQNQLPIPDLENDCVESDPDQQITG